MKPCKPRWLQGDGPVTQHGPRDPGETRISFTAGETAVPDVLRTVVASLQRRSVRQDDIDSAQIVLAELLNNVEEHAYDGREGGAVTLQMDLAEGHVSFSIFDHGKPMPEGPLPEGRLPEIDARLPFFPGASAVLVRSRRSFCRALSDGVGLPPPALSSSSPPPPSPKARSTC